MSAPLVPYAAAELLERVVIGGDLSKLAPAERLQYYREVCQSLGLNPLTRPLEYLHLSGKLTLYARRDATDQLRKLHQISVERLEREIVEGVYVVTAYVRDDKGRTDSDLGAVPVEGLKGEARANAILKAVTKAKRRATLSICGLGMLDETELETIPPEVLKAPPAPAVESDTESEPEPSEGLVTEARQWNAHQWKEAFQSFKAPGASPEALDALWRGVRLPEIWRTLSVPEQVELGGEYNAAKKRLGIR